MSFDNDYIGNRLSILATSRMFDFQASAKTIEDEMFHHDLPNPDNKYGVFAREVCGSVLVLIVEAYLRYCDDEKTDPQRHISILRSEIEKFGRRVRERFRAYAANFLDHAIDQPKITAFDEYMLQYHSEAEAALVDAARGRLHDRQIYQHVQMASAQAFVAMSFRANLKKAFENGIRPAIEGAGYSPLRVDQHQHINKIDDEIIGQIRRSRFVVADFTAQRQSVYYEAGFAYGVGLPVIYCCRKGDLGALHFDVRQYNCIVWDKPASLARQLQQRIEAIIGPGPNPVRNVTAAFAKSPRKKTQ